MGDEPIEPIPSEADVATVVDIARQFGHHAGRAWFSGVRAQPETGSVTVYRVSNAAFDAELTTLLGSTVPVELQNARFTRDELIIAREMAWALADRLQVDAITVPDDGTGISVYVHASVADAQHALDHEMPGLATAYDASLGATV